MVMILYTALCITLIAFASARSKESKDQHALRLNDEAEQEMDALVEEETRQLNEKIEDSASEFHELESKFNILKRLKTGNRLKDIAQQRQDVPLPPWLADKVVAINENQVRLRRSGTEIKETSKNESMLIAKSELNNTNSMNVSTQVTNPLKAKNDTVNATDKDASLKNVVNEIREGTEIKETSKNKSMPIAKSELNDTNSMNVSTQVTNPLKAKNDMVNATDKDASLKNVVNKIREEIIGKAPGRKQKRKRNMIEDDYYDPGAKKARKVKTGEYVMVTSEDGTAYASSEYGTTYKADKAFGEAGYWCSVQSPDTPVRLWFQFKERKRVVQIKFEEEYKMSGEDGYEVFGSDAVGECGGPNKQIVLTNAAASVFVTGKEFKNEHSFYCYGIQTNSYGAKNYVSAKKLKFGFEVDTCCKKDDPKCLKYKGTKSTTSSGKKCQAWNQQSPQDHTMTKSKFDAGDFETNYCRNPSKSGNSDGAWCYTMDGNIRWESCGIPTCEAQGQALALAQDKCAAEKFEPVCDTDGNTHMKNCLFEIAKINNPGLEIKGCVWP